MASVAKKRCLYYVVYREAGKDKRQRWIGGFDEEAAHKISKLVDRMKGRIPPDLKTALLNVIEEYQKPVDKALLSELMDALCPMRKESLEIKAASRELRNLETLLRRL